MATTSAKDSKAREMRMMADSELSRGLAMNNAKEVCQLKMHCGYLDRAKRALIAGIESDQKVVLARFETMVRKTRLKQAQLTCDSYSMRRLRETKLTESLRPSAVLADGRELSSLLGIEQTESRLSGTFRSESATRSTGGCRSSPRRQERRPLPLQSSNERNRRQSCGNGDIGHSLSESRTYTDLDNTDLGRLDGVECQVPTSPILTKVIPRPTTAEVCASSRSIVNTTAELSRVRSAPATAGRGRNSRACDEFLKTRNDPVSASSCERTHTSTSGSKRRTSLSGGRISPRRDEISSKRTSAKRRGELRRVAKTTIMLKENRPSTMTSLCGDDKHSDVNRHAFGYESDIADWLLRRRRSKLLLNLQTNDQLATSDVNELGEDDRPGHVASLGSRTSDLIAKRLYHVRRRVPVFNPIEDDTAWKQETSAQLRSRSLTLKNISSGSNSTIQLSEAELDMIALQRNQLRRQYRRVARAAEEQIVLNRLIQHIV